MADDTERLIVMLEARITEFEKRMKKAEGVGTQTYTRLRRDSRSATAAMEADMARSTGRINQALAATSNRIGAFGKAFVGGLAVGAVSAGLGLITTGLSATVKGIAQVGDEAKRAGVSLQAFQEWKFVAEQNRIGVDSMVDGLKELNLRADEFVVTGGGAAAEAFARLGYTGAELAQKLKDPSALMLEIIGRLGELDKAAQIRVADELFGGTGGERFVALIDQGEEGIRRTIARGHELGVVLDTEMIEKAQELDRRWQALTASAGAFFQRLVIGAADGVASLAQLDEGLDLLGVKAEAKGVAELILELKDALLAAGDEASAGKMQNLVRELRSIRSEFAAGGMEAETFAVLVASVASQAVNTANEITALDGITFGGTIGALEGLFNALMSVAKAGAEASNSIPRTGQGLTSGQRDALSSMDTIALPVRATEAPPSRPNDIDFGYNPGTGGGAGGGGGGGNSEGYAERAAAIREETAALEAETLAFLAVAAGGKDYGDAVEYARKRAELLHAAQQEGREITPELTAEVDALALAYVTAGLNADDAAERLEKIKDNAEAGADALSEMFLSVLNGSQSAGEALGRLLLKIAEVQFQKAVLGLANNGGAVGGFLGKLGGLLSLSGGGYTGDGGTYEPKAIVHGGEYVFSKDAVQSIGVGRLESMHRSAKQGSDAVAQASAAAKPVVQEMKAPTVNTKIVNVLDPADILDKGLSSEVGSRVFINWMGRNSEAIKAATNR